MNMELVCAASDFILPQFPSLTTHQLFRHKFVKSFPNLNFTSSSPRTRVSSQSHKVNLSSQTNPIHLRFGYVEERMDKYFEAGNYDESLFSLERLVVDGFYKPNVWFCTKLINGFVDSKRIGKAVKVMEILETYGEPDDNAYKNIILGYCKLNEIESALQVFNRMRNRGLVPLLACYNSMLNMLLKNGKRMEAENLLKDMSLTKSEPNEATFSILMHSFCQDEKMDDAMRLLVLAMKKGVKPNTYLMTPLISTLWKMGRLDKAVVYIELMVSHGCLPSFRTYNHVLSLLLRTGRAEQALSLFEKLRDAGCQFDGVTYNIMIGGSWPSGDMTKVVRLVAEMIDRGIGLDHNTYNKLISCLCRDGFVDQAIALLEVMKSDGIIPCVKDYNVVLRGLKKANRLADAIELLEEMVLKKGCLPDHVAYRTLIVGIGLAGMDEEAEKLVDSLFEMGVLKSKSFKRCLWKPRSSLHRSAVDHV